MYVDPTVAAAAPPPSTLDDSNIRCMLGIVMTIQVAHRQLLVDVLTKLQALRADLASIRRSPSPPLFDDESGLPFGNSSQKKGVHMDGEFVDRGRFYVLKLLWSFRLNLGVSSCSFFFFWLMIYFVLFFVVYDRGRYYDVYICFLFHIVLH